MEENKTRSYSLRANRFQQHPFISDSCSEYYNFDIKDSKAWFTKFINSVRHGFKSFNTEILFQIDLRDKVVVLGQALSNDLDSKEKSLKKFKQILKEIPWVTYRSHFRPIITDSGKLITTDAGWGCTIRAGQMMLLSTLYKHFELGSFSNSFDDVSHLLKLVEDNLVSAPFSLHSILSLGGLVKKPGEWFSANDICISLVRLLEIHPIPFFVPVHCTDFNLNQLEIYSKACSVSETCLKEQSFQSLNWRNSLFLTIPLMLGLKKIEKKYFPALKLLFSTPYSAGAIVDKSGSAMFMIGFSKNNVILLDPHVLKKANKSLADFKSNWQNSFSKQVVLLDFNELGPSIGLGFYIKGQKEFAGFVEMIAANNETIQGLLVLGSEKEENQVMEDEDYFYL